MTESEKLFIGRRHPILDVRAEQISLNLRLMRGGRPYIDARLTRFPYEPESSWVGNPATMAKGRKDRAFFTNYAGRVVRKISQYAFSGEVQRNGIDEAFSADATKTRVTVDALMQEVSHALTATRWCWLQVDRSAASVDEQTGTVRPQSIAEREARGDRIFWSLWEPTSVVDWCFDSNGDLLWLITDESLLSNENPFAEALMERVRTLWQPGGGERWFIGSDGKVKSKKPFTLPANIVPFIPGGRIASDPWWFDEVEMIQAALLNLESVSHENIFQTVYPQTVLPASIMSDVGGADGQARTPGDIVKRVGLKYPITETAEESGITRYVMPDAGAIKSIPEEIQRRKRELYDIVGMAMSVPESRQVASAESKRWDHLDPEAVLKERAGDLQAIETKAVEMSRQLDSTFQVYSPVYPSKFDISDPLADVAALMQMSALDLPPLARRELWHASVRMLDKLAPIPDDRRREIDAEIATSDAAATPPLPMPPAPAR